MSGPVFRSPSVKRCAPVRLDLRDSVIVAIECRRCKVGGTFEGTAAFRIECVCGGQIRIVRLGAAPANREGRA